MPLEYLCDPVLESLGVAHGFGQRGSQVPEFTCFPTQVHGTRVVLHKAGADLRGLQGEHGDAIVSNAAGACVGIVTADCVPILAASESGGAVAAIHAGWRGLAAGVIEAGIESLRARAEAGEQLFAAIGPSAQGCCYEVDDPVRSGLGRRYARHLDHVMGAARAGHYLLDLPLLAMEVLVEAGLRREAIGVAHRACTICDADRFESYRRDGEIAGRLRHFIQRPANVGLPEGQG